MNKDPPYPSYLKPPVRELQGDEELWTEVYNASLLESDILRNVSYDENRSPTFPTTFFKVWPSGTTYRSRRKRIHCHTYFNTRPLVIDVFKYDGSVYII